jgi:phosphosulfolactate synthase
MDGDEGAETAAGRAGSDARASTAAYLEAIGVAQLPPLTTPFDPGYDPETFRGHLEQSAHLMAGVKISMACWMIADEEISRLKVSLARRHGVTPATGGGPFEVAVAQGQLEAYLDLCADMGFLRIECGEGFTDLHVEPNAIVGMARDRGLGVQFELGDKHAGAFAADTVDGLIEQGKRWLDAGASELVIEGRESASEVGLFAGDGTLHAGFADRFASTFGLEGVIFEAPTKSSQFALMEHFGPRVRLGNVRLEELLRVEIYRRGLHSDAFSSPRLRPGRPHRDAEAKA